MGIETPTESTNEDNYITDIYNYCDRWCQKCGYTTICEASTKSENTKEEDNKNKLFWKGIKKHLSENRDMVIEKATQNKLSVTEFEAPKQKKNFDLFQRDAKSNIILNAGRVYEDMVDDWFDDTLDNKLVEIIETPNGSTHRLIPENNINNAQYINSMFDVVLRYQLQVYLKLSRTFYSRGVEAETDNNGSLDSLGSAKTALSLLDRSMAAWGIILQSKQFDEESIFKLMLQIMRLQNNIETEFPDVRSFIRPGLDEL